MTSIGASNVTKDIGDRAALEASTARETLKNKSAEVVETVHDFVARSSKTAADLSDGAKAHLSAAADRVTANASHTFEAGKSAYHTSGKTIGRRVVKQPLEALMLAAAIGYLVGWATNCS